MPANMKKTFGRLPFLAWCEECSDGERAASAHKAGRWADKHNTEKHPPKKEG